MPLAESLVLLAEPLVTPGDQSQLEGGLKRKVSLDLIAVTRHDNLNMAPDHWNPT